MVLGSLWSMLKIFFRWGPSESLASTGGFGSSLISIYTSLSTFGAFNFTIVSSFFLTSASRYPTSIRWGGKSGRLILLLRAVRERADSWVKFPASFNYSCCYAFDCWSWFWYGDLSICGPSVPATLYRCEFTCFKDSALFASSSLLFVSATLLASLSSSGWTEPSLPPGLSFSPNS